jgi:hypothetical protein
MELNPMASSAARANEKTDLLHLMLASLDQCTTHAPTEALLGSIFVFITSLFFYSISLFY